LINNGSGLIFDTALNITWVQDANLLGTMEGRNPNLVTDIISTIKFIHDTPSYYDTTPYSGSHTLSINDFGNNGSVDWYGAQAFVAYLNVKSYEGSTHWGLPTTPDNVGNGYYITSSQLGELFYSELGAVSGGVIPSGSFINVQSAVYWSTNEYIYSTIWQGVGLASETAWDFRTFDGLHSVSDKTTSSNIYFNWYAWVVSPGDIIAPVPVPSAICLFGSFLVGFIGTNRRKIVQQ
jgi:hypothetical protein